MESNKFYNLLTQALEFPFLIEDVKDIDSNTGCVWIDLEDGRTFYISIEECEPLEQEEL